jgi:hypothetical protein
MEWPATKDRARALGVKYYFTGTACKHGHVAERFASSGACAECNRIKSREAQRALWAADPDAMRSKARDAYHRDIEKSRAMARDWRNRNLEKQREYERRWFEENPEKATEYARKHRQKKAAYYREYDAKWRDENRGRYRSYHRRRQAAKKQATPDWLTDDQFEAMVAIYEDAASRDEPHDVDHTIPLQHPDVCGLHVPWNLQVLSLAENRRKGNSFDGTMDNEGWRNRLPTES